MSQADKTPTPHIKARIGDFASTVLMPGDPLRSRYIAQNFLTDAVLVNDVRGVQGYTGYYKGKRVSVMASGMGMPSMGIYCYELFNFYDVQAIIRVGTAGGVAPDVQVRDVVIGVDAATTSDYCEVFEQERVFRFAADKTLLDRAVQACKGLNITPKLGSLYSTYVFYDSRPNQMQYLRRSHFAAVEMEAAALYHSAGMLGKQALCICTISDCPIEGISLPSEQRERSFTDMMRVALETAI